jgi:DNA polymerase-3 subunit epsilon
MGTLDRDLSIYKRPIAFTDIETTGLNATQHEIIEIGAVITRHDLEIIDEIDIKVRPEHIETASPKALEINGYSKERWLGAVSLCEALQEYSSKTTNALFHAHNPTFDWKFIEKGFEETGVENQLDYHRLDNFSIAWHALKNVGLEKLNQENLAEHLGLKPEPAEHRAINGARLSFEIYKRLMRLP